MIRVVLGKETDAATREIMKTVAGVPDGPLTRLFDTLSKRHPELAPILEDATHQSDLEIFVNNTRIAAEQAEALVLRDGDHVRLMVKYP